MSGIHILKGHKVHLQTAAYLIGSGEPVKVTGRQRSSVWKLGGDVLDQEAA